MSELNCWTASWYWKLLIGVGLPPPQFHVRSGVREDIVPQTPFMSDTVSKSDVGSQAQNLTENLEKWNCAQSRAPWSSSMLWGARAAGPSVPLLLGRKESHGGASYGLLQGFPNPCTATGVGGNRVPSQDGLSQEWHGVLVASADLQRLSGPGFCPGSPGLPDRPWPALCRPGQHEVT